MNLLLSSFGSSIIKDSHCSFCAYNFGKEVVGKEELCTATGVFEVLAGGVLGVAANVDAAFGIVPSFFRNSSGSLPACAGLLSDSPEFVGLQVCPIPQ